MTFVRAFCLSLASLIALVVFCVVLAVGLVLWLVTLPFHRERWPW